MSMGYPEDDPRAEEVRHALKAGAWKSNGEAYVVRRHSKPARATPWPGSRSI